ncbi:MAG: hypothetical protein IPI78_07700 [Chitinophagaceae bacterium]|nr:hypothetical protein [Chitinophagaceae bacterium]
MSDHSTFNGTKAGTAGGTLTILLANLSVTDLLQTAILAAIGALVSFITSILMKYLFKKWRKK